MVVVSHVEVVRGGVGNRRIFILVGKGGDMIQYELSDLAMT